MQAWAYTQKEQQLLQKKSLKYLSHLQDLWGSCFTGHCLVLFETTTQDCDFGSVSSKLHNWAKKIQYGWKSSHIYTFCVNTFSNLLLYLIGFLLIKCNVQIFPIFHLTSWNNIFLESSNTEWMTEHLINETELFFSSQGKGMSTLSRAC